MRLAPARARPAAAPRCAACSPVSANRAGLSSSGGSAARHWSKRGSRAFCACPARKRRAWRVRARRLLSVQTSQSPLTAIGANTGGTAASAGTVERHQHRIVALVNVVHQPGDQQLVRHRIQRFAGLPPFGQRPVEPHPVAGIARVLPIAVPARLRAGNAARASSGLARHGRALRRPVRRRCGSPAQARPAAPPPPAARTSNANRVSSALRKVMVLARIVAHALGRCAR